VLDKILAGNPITNAEYSQMGDLTQAGLQTVNSLCEALQITVNRGGNQFQQNYVRGIVQHDISISGAVCVSGTEIILKPDTAIFCDTKFSRDVLFDWLKDRSAGLTNFEFNVNIN